MPPGERAQALRPPLHRGTLRCEIATTHRGSPHVGEQDPLDLRRQTRRRNDDSFLVQLARARRHAAWRHAAHVGMVRADDAVPADLAVDFDCADEGEIGKVTAAAVGIVENEQVTRLWLEAADGRHGVSEGAEVHRNVRRLGDHLAIGIEQRSRCVAAFADIR